MVLRRGALAALGAAACLFSLAATAETVRVSIDKLSFTPKQISAHVGDTIEWTNGDFVAHTATARNKDWDVAIPVKGVARVTLTHAGDVDYFCRFHPNMTGRITVAP
jgi:plastocyanin